MIHSIVNIGMRKYVGNYKQGMNKCIKKNTQLNRMQ